MRKIKLLVYLTLISGLFFTSGSGFANAFDMTGKSFTETNFSTSGSTFGPVTFLPGGGTLCGAYPPADANCPTVTLPCDANVTSATVTISEEGTPIGTPYIWVPISVANGHIAQIDTRDGFEVEIARYKVGTNPSRTFIIPGGDVWVANRDSGNVTKLSPLTGDQLTGGICGDGLCGMDENIYICPTDCNGNVCGDGTGICKNNVACGSGTENCREYKMVDNYPTGGGPRGVTGDSDGNIWVGNYTSANVVKLDANTGVILSTVITGGGPYGLIADQFGYVWVSNAGAGTVQSINITSGAITQTVAIAGAPYGIGIDANGDILVASCTGASATKINGYGTSTPGTIAWSVPLMGGASTRGRGIASDLNGNIWVGSDNGASGTVYSFKPDGTQYCPFYNPSPQHNTVGVAVDFDNNIWAVPYDGNVLKLKPNNVAACTSVVHVADVSVAGGLLYNYSDMTGLRTVPKKLTIGTGTVPGTTTGSDTVFSGDAFKIALNNALSGTGQCEVPLYIYSMTAGNFTLKDLKIEYNSQVPVTIGGLVPCGREWNDPSTSWNDTDDCNLCYLILMAQLIIEFLVELAAIVAAFFLSVAGYYYIFAGGNPEKITLAKNIFSKALIGFLIILIAWIIVDSILAAFGYIDPTGDGNWHIMC